MQYYMGSAFFTQSYPQSEALNFVYVHQRPGYSLADTKTVFCWLRVFLFFFDLPYVINERESERWGRDQAFSGLGCGKSWRRGKGFRFNWTDEIRKGRPGWAFF